MYEGEVLGNGEWVYEGEVLRNREWINNYIWVS